MGLRGGYCPVCGRTGLTVDDFPKSPRGYIHGVCLACERAKVQRYREMIYADPAAHERRKKHERERLRRYRAQRRGAR